MTIFDTLRYSNIDISNEDELQKLPRPLLEAWAEEITTGYNRTGYVSIRHPQINFSSLARHSAAHRALKACPGSAFKANVTQHLFEEIYKEQFTVLLKKMIAEYDTEVSISNL